MDPNEIVASHDKYIWKLIHSIESLHGELASLYQLESRDQKRIDLLWRAIEERESMLFLEGYSVDGVKFA